MDKIDEVRKGLQIQIDRLKKGIGAAGTPDSQQTEKIKMVNYASTPSGKKDKDMSKIRSKMSHNIAASVKDSNSKRSGGVSFKSK